MPDVDVDYDLADLLLVFDDLASWTDEDRGVYALRYRRDDDVSVLLDFSVHEGKVGILITRGEVGYAQVEFQRCRRIQALDVPNKVVEVRSDQLRGLPRPAGHKRPDGQTGFAGALRRWSFATVVDFARNGRCHRFRRGVRSAGST